MKKSLGAIFTLVALFMLMTMTFPGTAFAAAEEDILMDVTGRNAQLDSNGVTSGTEPVTGGSYKFYEVSGDVGGGNLYLSLCKPTSASVQSIIDSKTKWLGEGATINRIPMNGYELWEITYADYSWGLPNDEAVVWLIHPQYVIGVELYETGYEKAVNLQKEKEIALQVIEGLSNAGLLGTALPASTPGEPSAAAPADIPGAGQTGKPLDEPVEVSNTMNIAGVYNGPNAPTTFTINSPHLVTEIHDYHWNNAQGKTPGTIGLQDQNGTMYGPWQAAGTPGQGGVPDANWIVYPNIVIPAGTYTIIDSDPASWSQNSGSGGQGMGYVKATPHFETYGSPSGDTNKSVSDGFKYPPCECESPAGVGSVGNIPGPSNTTEAVTGVVVPGLIATALGTLAGLGGGFTPPAGGTPIYPTGAGPLPGAGGIPGAGGSGPGMAQATSQIGRRGKEEIYIDTVEVFEGSLPGQPMTDGDILIDPAAEAGIIIDTIHDKSILDGNGILIDGPEEAGIFIDDGIIIDTIHDKSLLDGKGILIDGPEEAGIFIDNGIIIDTSLDSGHPDEKGILIDGQEEAGVLIDDGIIMDTIHDKTLLDESGMPADGEIAAGISAAGADGEIPVDTSAMDGETAGEPGTGPEETPYDREGYDKEGYDAEGYDRDGFNAEGYDRDGFNAEGYDKDGFNAEGYDKEGFNAEGYDRDGFNSEGYDKDGFNAEGYDKEGFNAEGYDKDGFNAEGYNRDGFNAEGYDKDGFNAEGYDKEGFNAEGYDKDGFNAEGYDKEGFNAEGYDKDGFNAEGYDKEGFNAEGYDKDGFNAEGYDRDGFNAEGYDKEGFNAEGYNKEGFNAEGYDKDGFNAEGYNKEGFNAKGYDKEGYNKEGFDAQGFDREGYDKSGYDNAGYDRDGFNKAGYDQEGYNRNGFDQEGFGRDGYDVNGYNRKGYNRQGFDAEGYDKQGFDKAGFNKDGFDREGYDRNGFNQKGYDREGYDKNGYDANGYDRDGYDREGKSQEGYDAEGYDKKGFNENGYDRDGYDREGFNYEGYNRSGYDPWGYDKQGYGKDGYHWSGYDADGYDRNGRHWSEGSGSTGSTASSGPGSPFDVSTEGDHKVHRSPFTEDRIIIDKSVSTRDQSPAAIGDDFPEARETPELSFGDKPTKPPLGQPYPKTVEKYGAKPWDDKVPAPEPEKPSVPKDSGIIGPEDPMNTLEKHDLGAGREVAGDSTAIKPEYQPANDMPVVSDGEIPAGPPPVTGPLHGDTITLPGKDGKDYVLDYNEKTGEWENLLTGGKIKNENLDDYIKDFNRWQDDVAEDLRRSAIDMEKMAARQDANSKAIDEALGKWKQLEQMQKAADKYGIGEKGGPGDMDKAIQDLKDDMLAGKELDTDRMEQLKDIIKNRIEGKSTGDSGLRKEEDWMDTLGYALEANLATAKEVVTGQQADGSISWKGMAARIIMTTATGGVPGKLIDGGLTVAEAYSRIKESVDQGESDFRAVSKAMGILVLGEQAGWLAGKGMGALNKSMLERFPVFTNKAADFVEKALLKGSALNQQLSRKLGLISKESAESALNAINKRLVEIGGDEAIDKMIKQAAGKQGAAAGGRTAAAAAQAAGKTTHSAGKAAQAAGKTVQSAGKASQAAGKTAAVAKPTGKPSLKTVSAETPGLKLDNNSFKEAGLPPDLRGMPVRDQKAIRSVCDKYGVKAHMRPTNPDSKVWLESGRAHPKPEMIKSKTINQLDVELGYPKENIGTVGCRRPDPLPAAKPAGMDDVHWASLQKRHTQRMTEFTDQAGKLKHLEKEGKIVWDQKTGIIYNKQTMKPYCGDHDTFALVDAVSGKPVSPRMNEQINRELQSLGATQHPEHVGWDYSGLSNKVPDGAAPGAQSPRDIAEAIDKKILSGHGEGGEALNTYDPLRGEQGSWTTNWWKGGVRE